MFFRFIEDFSILFNNNIDFHFGVLSNTKEYPFLGERD